MCPENVQKSALQETAGNTHEFLANRFGIWYHVLAERLTRQSRIQSLELMVSYTKSERKLHSMKLCELWLVSRH